MTFIRDTLDYRYFERNLVSDGFMLDRFLQELLPKKRISRRQIRHVHFNSNDILE